MCYDIDILSLYIDNELDITLSSSINTHINICSNCKNKINLISSTSKLIKRNYFNIEENLIDSILEKIHPTFEQISLYYDNELSETSYKSIDEHISSCLSCNNILNNIKSISKPLEFNIIENEVLIENIIDNLDCINIDDISAYYDNEITNISYKKIENHLKHCDKCNNKFNLIKIESSIMTKLPNPILDINFADKVLEKIDEENKIINISKYFRKSTHKIAMFVAILISAFILTIPNQTSNNKVQISVLSEDMLFSNKVDSLTLLSENDVSDELLIQDIGL